MPPIISWPFILLRILPMPKPKSAAIGTVSAAAARKLPKPCRPHSSTRMQAICAAIAPMVMAKLMPMPATIGMISASTMNALRERRPNSSYMT